MVLATFLLLGLCLFNSSTESSHQHYLCSTTIQLSFADVVCNRRVMREHPSCHRGVDRRLRLVFLQAGSLVHGGEWTGLLVSKTRFE